MSQNRASFHPLEKKYDCSYRSLENRTRFNERYAWHESTYYTPRERAALAWTECLTLISEKHAPESVWQEVCEHFNEHERVALTFAINTINAWNRFSIAFNTPHPKAW